MNKYKAKIGDVIKSKNGDGFGFHVKPFCSSEDFRVFAGTIKHINGSRMIFLNENGDVAINEKDLFHNYDVYRNIDELPSQLTDNNENVITKLAEQNQDFYNRIVEQSDEIMNIKQTNKTLKEEKESLIQHNMGLVKLLNKLMK